MLFEARYLTFPPRFEIPTLKALWFCPDDGRHVTENHNSFIISRQKVQLLFFDIEYRLPLYQEGRLYLDVMLLFLLICKMACGLICDEYIYANIGIKLVRLESMQEQLTYYFVLCPASEVKIFKVIYRYRHSVTRQTRNKINTHLSLKPKI